MSNILNLSDSTGLRYLADSTGSRYLADSTGLRYLSESTGSRYLSDSTEQLKYLTNDPCIFDSDCNMNYICLRGDCIERPEHELLSVSSPVSPTVLSPPPTFSLPTIAPYTINVFQEYTYFIEFSVILILLCVWGYCCTTLTRNDDYDDDDNDDNEHVSSSIYDA